MSASTPRDEFIQEQYRVATAAIDRQKKMRWDWQRTGLIAFFAFYSFLLSHDNEVPTKLRYVVYLLPPIFSLIGFYVSRRLNDSILIHSNFIKTLEKYFDFDGWETWVYDKRSRTGNIIHDEPMTVAGYLFWPVMFLLSVLFYILWLGYLR